MRFTEKFSYSFRERCALGAARELHRVTVGRASGSTHHVCLGWWVGNGREREYNSVESLCRIHRVITFKATGKGNQQAQEAPISTGWGKAG